MVIKHKLTISDGYIKEADFYGRSEELGLPGEFGCCHDYGDSLNIDNDVGIGRDISCERKLEWLIISSTQEKNIYESEEVFSRVTTLV